MVDVEDPVCKMTFPEESAEELGALKLVHNGKTLWFCSPTCLHEFEIMQQGRRAPGTP